MQSGGVPSVDRLSAVATADIITPTLGLPQGDAHDFAHRAIVEAALFESPSPELRVKATTPADGGSFELSFGGYRGEPVGQVDIMRWVGTFEHFSHGSYQVTRVSTRTMPRLEFVLHVSYLGATAEGWIKKRVE